MKAHGTVKVNGLRLPETSPVQLDGVEISYEVQFSVGELVEMIKVIPTLPDVLADTFRKFKAYEKEFNADKDAEAAKEVNSVLEDIKNQDKQTA